MKRRTFLLSGVGLLVTPTVGWTQTSQINAILEIKRLRINSGLFAGGYQIAPLGSLNWYFTNLGLLAIVQHLTRSDREFYIRAYLDLYLSRLEANATIRNITFDGGNPLANYNLELSDSDDAYAATFLSLAAMYIKRSKNRAWFRSYKNSLKDIAYYNLAVPTKPNGLSSVFQSPRNQNYNIGFLMDNCEAYRGLRDFSAILRSAGDSDASYYDSFANGIVRGIASILFDAVHGGFVPNDSVSIADNSFYPGATCQVFPQAFDLGELSPYFTKAWNYLNTYAPGWEYNLTPQNKPYDPFPWCVLGFVAAKRGAVSKAQAQMRTTESLFMTNPEFVTINELGFYHKTKSYL